MSKAMPFFFMIWILASFYISQMLPIVIKQQWYALSLFIQSGIVFVLPYIIFSLLFKTAVQLSHRATHVIMWILIFVTCSNFLSTWLSHYIGLVIYHQDLAILMPKPDQQLSPAWQCIWPKLLPNNVAMLLGIFMGISVAWKYPERAPQWSSTLDSGCRFILRVMGYAIPIFVSGFVVKLEHENILSVLLHDYSYILGAILIAQYTYITLLYGVSDRFHWFDWSKSIRNMLPAMVTGFSTMSSVAAMPLTIIATEKNSKNIDFSRAVIPATVNIHLIGDCFAIPILAYAILKSYGLPAPMEMTYLLFSVYFILAKFSVAAIPGGGIIVMLPIIAQHLGFSPDMLALITAMYILFDPVITSANVFGNGAFAKISEILIQRK